MNPRAQIFFQRSLFPGRCIQSNPFWNVSCSARVPIPPLHCRNHQAFDSPLDVLSNDLEYLEGALGVDLHSPFESVVEAHDKVVCTLNPIVATRRSKELETKVQELHHELVEAHSDMHKTEDRLHQSIQYLTEMEDKLSRIQTMNADSWSAVVAQLPKAKAETRVKSRPLREIENNLELSQELMNFWYPVEFTSQLKTEKEIKLELFGQEWILQKEPSSNTYHCCEVSTSRSLPVCDIDGFLWIWPGDKVPSEIPRCSMPPSDFQIHAELTMEVPVEHGLLLENLLDLAHAPFTHTSTFAKGWPIPDIVKFQTSKLLGGNWDPYPIDMSFEVPCMVLSSIGLAQPGKIERGVRAANCQHHLHQLHVCLPTNNRTTKLLYRMSLDFMHWTKHIPGIQSVWKNVAKEVLGEDLVLVIGQQNRMLKGSSVWKNPVTYDKLGIRYRRWRNSVGSPAQTKAEHQLRKLNAGEIFSPEFET